jgi:hypothetical protein
MNGKYTATDLVADHLKGKYFFLCGNRAAVHQQAGWFVDCDKVVVLV